MLAAASSSKKTSPIGNVNSVDTANIPATHCVITMHPIVTVMGVDLTGILGGRMARLTIKVLL